MDDWRSQYDYELHPKARPGFPAPADFPERVARLLSELLTAQYGEEYGVKITVVTKKMAAERAKAAGA